jgi:hypothetical protein
MRSRFFCRTAAAAVDHFVQNGASEVTLVFLQLENNKPPRNFS